MLFEKMTQKEFNTITKAVFYQLFNRKLPFVMFSGDEENSSFWLFTNVSYETILVYDSNPDYFYSIVHIKNQDYIDIFYQLFPVLKTTPCLIRVVDFLSTLSKVSDIEKCSIIINMGDVILQYPDKNEEIVQRSIGQVIMDIDVDMYKTLWKLGINETQDEFSKSFEHTDLKDEDGRVLLDLYDTRQTEENVQKKITAIMQFGYNIPSLNMFLKNLPKQNKSFTIHAGYDKDSVSVYSIYDTDLLTCISSQPSQRWIVKRLNNPKQDEVKNG